MKNHQANENFRKLIFVVESDDVKIKEIKEAFSHKRHWDFVFYKTAANCISNLDKKPVAVFIDVDNKDIGSNKSDTLHIIDEIKHKSHSIQVVVFAENENEELAAEVLKHGALDYIINNAHRYTNMEAELNWVEYVADKEEENRKTKQMMWYIIGVILLVAIAVGFLLANGYLVEGNSAN